MFFVLINTMSLFNGIFVFMESLKELKSIRDSCSMETVYPLEAVNVMHSEKDDELSR